MILSLAVCAVLAGARSFTAIAEWAADADRETLASLGVTGAVPSDSTFRRTLQRLDVDAFDMVAGHCRRSRDADRLCRGPASGHEVYVFEHPVPLAVGTTKQWISCGGLVRPIPRAREDAGWAFRKLVGVGDEPPPRPGRWRADAGRDLVVAREPGLW